jgi:hypothetical protein
MKLKVKAEFEEEATFNSIKFNSNEGTCFEMKKLSVENAESKELVFSFLKEGNSVINFTKENT